MNSIRSVIITWMGVVIDIIIVTGGRAGSSHSLTAIFPRLETFLQPPSYSIKKGKTLSKYEVS